MAYMDYMDPNVCCPKKAGKLNHSLTYMSSVGKLLKQIHEGLRPWRLHMEYVNDDWVTKTLAGEEYSVNLVAIQSPMV